jgi:hypothetical protein
MNPFADLLLHLGMVSGALTNESCRAEMIALLRTPQGLTTAGYLNYLRDAIGSVLRESSREPPYTPQAPLPLQLIIEIRDALLPGQGEEFNCVAFAYAIQSALENPQQAAEATHEHRH